jgi:hypothetical protein
VSQTTATTTPAPTPSPVQVPTAVERLVAEAQSQMPASFNSAEAMGWRGVTLALCALALAVQNGAGYLRTAILQAKS